MADDADHDPALIDRNKGREFHEFPKWLHRWTPATAPVPPVDPRMHGVTIETVHDRALQVDLVCQAGIVDTAEVAADLQAAGWVTHVETARQAALEAVRREEQRRKSEEKDRLKQAVREALAESFLTDGPLRAAATQSVVAAIDSSKPIEPQSLETPIAHGVPAGRDRLPPLETEEQRRDAVNGKLARVRQDTEEPLHSDTDFWKASKEYQHRKTFENWLKKGPDGSQPAHEVFCRLLRLPSAEFVAARRLWRKKPKRRSQKKPVAD